MDSSNKRRKKANDKHAKSFPSRSGGKYHCNYCGRDITGLTRIKCGDCKDFDLCLDCFSVGVEIHHHNNTMKHQSNHAYYVMDDMSVPLFTEDWVAEEELLLLEGIEMFGLGNWADVADHVGTKSKDQCEEHYFAVYIESPSGPIPSQVSVEAQWAYRKRLLEENAAFGNYVEGKIGDESGYIELRGDLTSEWDDEAEAVLNDLDFTDQDTEQDIALKLGVLESYNFKLSERDRRKQVALDYEVVDIIRFLARKKSWSPEESDLRERFWRFARLMPAQEFENLISGLLEESRLRRKIQLLQRFRSFGCRSWDDVIANIKSFENLSESDLTELTSHRPSEGRLRFSDQVEILRKEKGGDVLSQSELNLCISLSLSPNHYLTIKELFLRENLRLGYLARGAACNLIRGVEILKLGRIYDFFVEQGWLSSPMKPMITFRDQSSADGIHVSSSA